MRRHLGRARAPSKWSCRSGLRPHRSNDGPLAGEVLLLTEVSRSRGALRASLQRRGRWRWPATLSTFSARCGHLWRKTRPNAGFLQMHNLQGLRLRHEAQDSYLHILIGGQRSRFLPNAPQHLPFLHVLAFAFFGRRSRPCQPTDLLTRVVRRIVSGALWRLIVQGRETAREPDHPDQPWSHLPVIGGVASPPAGGLRWG